MSSAAILLGALRQEMKKKICESKITEFANSIDPDKMAHSEPPQRYLHSSNSQYDTV